MMPIDALDPRRRQGRWRAGWRLIVAPVAILSFAVAAWGLHVSADGPTMAPARPVGGDPASSVAMPSIAATLPPPDLVEPLSPEEAVRANARRAFAGRADEPARGVTIAAEEPIRLRALDCLTQAIYYEAATEGAAGGRAVAQVVLNRMRHPGFPASVCGVVYQGSHLATGCQFSFTCDGSLRRVPVAALWARSRRVAEEALAGGVFAAVGHATHYHADYVLPYWAGSLDKMVQIGRHIFYRLPGGLGSARLFRQAYSGLEPVVSGQAGASPEAPLATAAAVESAATAMAEVLATEAQEHDPALTAASGDMNRQPEPPVVLADARVGTLIHSGSQSSAAPAPRRPAEECSGRPGAIRLRPLGADDLRSAATSGAC